MGTRRDVGYVVDVGSPAFVQALEDAVVAVMIEKASGVEHLEAMLSVKSVDMVQFGPADYSMSIDWFKGNGAKLRAMMGA